MLQAGMICSHAVEYIEQPCKLWVGRYHINTAGKHRIQVERSEHLVQLFFH